MEKSKTSDVKRKYQQAIRDYKKMIFLYQDESIEPIKKDSEAIISDWESLRKRG